METPTLKHKAEVAGTHRLLHGLPSASSRACSCLKTLKLEKQIGSDYEAQALTTKRRQIVGLSASIEEIRTGTARKLQ